MKLHFFRVSNSTYFFYLKVTIALTGPSVATKEAMAAILCFGWTVFSKIIVAGGCRRCKARSISSKMAMDKGYRSFSSSSIASEEVVATILGFEDDRKDKTF